MGYIGNVKIGNTTHLVGSTLYGTCSTAAETAAKVVTCANFDQLLTGVTIYVKFTNSNTATTPTLNVNGTGAKNIYLNGTTKPGNKAATSWYPNSIVPFTYDGTNWIIDNCNIHPEMVIPQAVSVTVNTNVVDTYTSIECHRIGCIVQLSLYDVSLKKSGIWDIISGLPPALSYVNVPGYENTTMEQHDMEYYIDKDDTKLYVYTGSARMGMAHNISIIYFTKTLA